MKTRQGEDYIAESWQPVGAVDVVSVAAADAQVQQRKHLVACWRHPACPASVTAVEVADVGVASGSCPEGVWGVQGVLEALKQKIERQLQGGQGVWVVRGGQAAQKRKQAVWGALGPSEGAQEEAQSQELGWQS